MCDVRVNTFFYISNITQCSACKGRGAGSFGLERRGESGMPLLGESVLMSCIIQDASVLWHAQGLCMSRSTTQIPLEGAIQAHHVSRDQDS